MRPMSATVDPMPIRMLIADDCPDYLCLLELMLAPLVDVDLVATAQSGTEAVRLAELEKVDMAVLDIDRPGLSGFDTTQAIRRNEPRTTVILQTGRFVEDVRQQADELGLVVLGKFELIKNLELLAALRTDRKAA